LEGSKMMLIVSCPKLFVHKVGRALIGQVGKAISLLRASSPGQCFGRIMACEFQWDSIRRAAVGVWLQESTNALFNRNEIRLHMTSVGSSVCHRPRH